MGASSLKDQILSPAPSLRLSEHTALPLGGPVSLEVQDSQALTRFLRLGQPWAPVGACYSEKRS